MSGRRSTRHAIRRFRWNTAYGAAGTLVCFIAAQVHGASALESASLGTAYASLLLLAVTLVLGPLNVLRGTPNPVSADVRRDAGIWAAMFGLAHTILGLQVHMSGRMIRYFLPESTGAAADPQNAAFLAANYLGLFATLILVLLLAVSNDISLSRLGSERWKRLQRSTYLAAVLVALHAALYQLIEKRRTALVACLLLVCTAVLIVQLRGRSIRLGTGQR